MRTPAFFLIISFALVANSHAQCVRIATFNLNWANRRGDKVLEVLAKANCDLVCFQETTVASEKFLKQRLSATHPFFYAAGHKGRYTGERFAFASKTELADVEFTAPREGLFGFLRSKFTLGDQTINVVNVHLNPFQIDRGKGIRDAMAELSNTEDTHAAEIAEVAKVIDVTKPTIVLGDFNSISTFTAPQRLVKLGLVDAFAAKHEDADTLPTWKWPTRPLPLLLRIDYIFHSAHFATTESEIVHGGGSDHSLVYAELNVGEPAKSTH